MKNLDVLATITMIAFLGLLPAPSASAAGFDVHAYSFAKAPFIPPTIVEDLITRIGDGGNQVLAIDLTDSVESNRRRDRLRRRRQPRRRAVHRTQPQTRRHARVRSTAGEFPNCRARPHHARRHLLRYERAAVRLTGPIVGNSASRD